VHYIWRTSIDGLEHQGKTITQRRVLTKAAMPLKGISTIQRVYRERLSVLKSENTEFFLLNQYIRYLQMRIVVVWQSQEPLHVCGSCPWIWFKCGETLSRHYIRKNWINEKSNNDTLIIVIWKMSREFFLQRILSKSACYTQNRNNIWFWFSWKLCSQKDKISTSF
jgi:hypothetical protein